MPFDVTECLMVEMSRHPRLADRTNARFRVRLRESLPSSSLEHELFIRVSANTNESMSEAAVRTALLVRAEAIIQRTIAAADLPSLKTAAE